MAYQPININPLDLKPSTAIGVSIPFSTPGVFSPVYTTQEQLKYNIINFLLTGRRERVFQPTFGAGLRELLFEQMTPDLAATVEATIRSGMERYFPNVVVTDMKVTPLYDENTITISFSYTVTNTNQTDQIVLNFENG